MKNLHITIIDNYMKPLMEKNPNVAYMREGNGPSDGIVIGHPAVGIMSIVHIAMSPNKDEVGYSVLANGHLIVGLPLADLQEGITEFFKDVETADARSDC